ncbi:MAG: hypothetical protein FJ100_04045 [Deltaproteobacteria bacterium]|nr:hypothetical protein [Deltaproteobacteria bacterium]
MNRSSPTLRFPSSWLVVCAAAAVAGWSPPVAAAPNPMTVQQIVDIAKTVPGFSYWWGGSKWKPGSPDKGKCTPNPGSSGCPQCSHSGPWGADCSGFVGKAWQVDKPVALDVAYHPYSTLHFTNNTTWWTHPPKAEAQLGDAFTYNKNGAGHIFLYEKGNVWGNVYAWECKGCSYGCVYGLRSVSADYINARRELIQAPAPTCKKHCEGTKIVDEKCGVGDCAAFGAKCVDDSLGVRCVSVFCPAQGTTTTCLPDPKNGKIATCVNGALKDEANCGAYGAICSTAVPPKPKCVAALCEDDPKVKPVAGDLCHQGKRLTCNAAGDLSDNPCPAGAMCLTTAGKTGPGSATCGPKPCGACDDGNPCTTDGCSNGACTHVNNAAACDDNNPCTTGDVCGGGACKGKAKDCGDGVACTADTCNNGACVHQANPAACNDANPCTADACGSAGCQNKPTNGACDDGDPCTAGGGCQNGVCKLGGVKNCDDDNACTVDACTAGQCTNAPVAAACDDGDACSVGDYCAAGVCLAGGVKPCSDGNPCTLDACVDGACVHSPTTGGEPLVACDGNAVVKTDPCTGKVVSKKACATGLMCVEAACVKPAPDGGGATGPDAGATAPDADAKPDAGGKPDTATAEVTPKPDTAAATKDTVASGSSDAAPSPRAETAQVETAAESKSGFSAAAADGGFVMADSSVAPASAGSTGNPPAPAPSCQSGPASQGAGWAWLLALCALGLTRRRI